MSPNTCYPCPWPVQGGRVHLVPVERVPPLAAAAATATAVRASVTAAGRGILVADTGRSPGRDAGRG